MQRLQALALLSLVVLSSQVQNSKSKNPDQYYDVVIVGSGLAGLSAAIECAEANKNHKIIVLEKEKSVGGNSMKSSSGMNAAQTPVQISQNVSDTYQQFFEDTIKSGKGFSDPELVAVLSQQSTEAWQFLTQHGVDLSALTILGGHSVARSHRPNNGALGVTIITTLKNYILKNLTSQVKISLESEVLQLMYVDEQGEDNTKQQGNQPEVSQRTVTGVKVAFRQVSEEVQKDQKIEPTQVFASSVILATGGFSYDRGERSLLKQYRPDLISIPTTNGRFAKGQGMKMARMIGAELIHMDKIQIHPTGLIDPQDPYSMNKFLGPELLRGSGGLLIDKYGKRFCNELGYRDYVSQMIFQNAPVSETVKQSIVLVVFNEEAAKMFGKTLSTYMNKHLIFTIQGGAELAKMFNFSAETFKKTLEEYNQYADKGTDPFGKTVFPVKFNFSDTFYYAQVTPSVHYTMGGIKINDKAQAIMRTKNGDAFQEINRLYAAGEVTGGVHGDNRLGGNSILECVVFGRIAGQESAKLPKNTKLIINDKSQMKTDL